jgi:hypothetical protein
MRPALCLVSRPYSGPYGRRAKAERGQSQNKCRGHQETDNERIQAQIHADATALIASTLLIL